MHSKLFRVAFLTIASIGTSPALGADRLHVVAFSGNAAPGTAPGVAFADFGPPALNNAGETAFIAALSGPDVVSGNSIGFWSDGGGGGRRLVARQGDLAPGGTIVGNFHYYVLNDVGQTAFRASVFGSSTAEGIWSEGGGFGLGLVARTGLPVPGFPPGVTLNTIPGGGFFPSHESPVFNNAGQVVFRGTVVGPGISEAAGNDFGVWRGTSFFDLEPMMVARDTQTGYANGVDYYSWGHPTLNDAGQVAFGGATTTGNSTFVTMPDGSTRLIPADALFPPALNNAGQVVYQAGTGVWSEGGGPERTRVAVSGTPAPGGAGRRFANAYYGFINHGGKIAFVGDVRGPGIQPNVNSFGIWKQTESFELSEVARQGTQAPGAPPGVLFGMFRYPVYVINGLGQVAFYNVMSNGAAGIWAQDVTGVLKPIIVEGTQFDVDPGPSVDLRTVAYVNLFAASGNEDGLASSFNELGQIAFNAEFTGGSTGVFVSDLVAVPEPSGMGFAAIAAAVNWLRLRRRTRRAPPLALPSSV